MTLLKFCKNPFINDSLYYKFSLVAIILEDSDSSLTAHYFNALQLYTPIGDIIVKAELHINLVIFCIEFQNLNMKISLNKDRVLSIEQRVTIDDHIISLIYMNVFLLYCGWTDDNKISFIYQPSLKEELKYFYFSLSFNEEEKPVFLDDIKLGDFQPIFMSFGHLEIYTYKSGSMWVDSPLYMFELFREEHINTYKDGINKFIMNEIFLDCYKNWFLLEGA